MRVIATILCIVLAICSLGIQSDVQAYSSISFNVANATLATYRDFVEAVREFVSRGTRTVNGLPVLNPESKVLAKNRFVLVRLINHTSVPTLAIDVVNLYVVAFSGANNTSHFLKEDKAVEYKNLLFNGTQKKDLPFSGRYESLEKQTGATGRGKLPLGPKPLAVATIGLWKDDRVARQLLVVIQMVSEAARFRYIEEQVRKSITNNNTFTPKGLILSMEKNWSTMSSAVLNSKDGENFTKSIQLKDDNNSPLVVNDFTTLSRYTMIAILYDKTKL